MPLLRPGIRRLFHLGTLRPRDAARDVDDEMALHIELRAQKLVREGLDPAAAHAEARRLFARSDAVLRALYTTAEERNEHMAMRDRWDSLVQDTRYAARRLAREPLVAAFILATLALGIGANVTAFSLVDRLLLRGPAHVREPDRLVRLYRRVDSPPLGLQTAPWMPWITFTSLRESMRTVEALGAYRVDDAIVGTGAAARKRRVGRATGNLFPLLGVRAVRGRFFSRDESAAASQLAVLNERVWRSDFGADPGVIGQIVVVGDVPRTVIGIAPAEFSGPDVGRVDVWTMIDEGSARSQNWKVVARLRDGVAPSVASADAEAAHARTRDGSPAWIRGATLLAAPIRYDDNARESIETVMARWLAAVSAIILLITCANIANLLLARVARRRRELATRVALGSGRGRVVRLLVLEGLLLAVGGAAASFVVTAVAEPVVQRALFPGGAWTFSFADGRLLLVVVAITILAGALVAVAPAVQAGSLQLTAALRSGGREGSSRSRLRSILTVVQAALSVVLLIGAGLFLRSLAKVGSVDLGIEPDRVVAVEAHYPRSRMSFDEMLRIDRERHARLLAVARRVPGVERATVSVGIPFDGSFMVGLWVAGWDSIPALPGGGPYVTAVADDYFSTMGTPILRGRAFALRDREGSDPVVIINSAMAHALWPNKDALGQCMRIQDPKAECARVVGIAADIHRSGLREEPSMQYYVPVGQERGFGGSWLLVRPRGEATESWPALQQAILAADPSITAVELRMLSKGLEGEMRPLRLGMVTFGLSAVLALVVAALGLYSVMAYAVAWRTHELGIRLALGATTSEITRLVVSGSAKLAALGIAAGLVIALVGRRWLEPRLFETSASDPLVLVTVVCVLQAVALLAGWLPARRAARISPTEALRAE
jgi:predicted permease